MDKIDKRQVSCYLNEQLKLALEKEANYYKSQNDSSRDSINKNMIYIINSFIDDYENNIGAISDRFIEVLSKDDNKIDSKEIARKLQVGSHPYPLKFTKEISKKFNDFRVKVNEYFNIKITKINFYNFVLLEYFIRNKVQIAKKDLLFWMQDYFSRNKSLVDFKDLLRMFNDWAQKEESKDGNSK